MKATLILNQSDEIALFYGDPLKFIPEWASIDVERGEIFIANSDESGDGKHFILDEIKTEIYERILPDTRILLVYVIENNFTKVQATNWVPLMIAQQI